jgi:hypothetical protein
MSREKELLAHAIKALRYRFKKAVAGSKESFGAFRVGSRTRTPSEIINHMYELATKIKSQILEGHLDSAPPAPLPFRGEVERFVLALDELTSLVIREEPSIEEIKRLLQGPVIDIGTHVGQLAMLNGLHGNKIPRENYYAIDLD